MKVVRTSGLLQLDFVNFLAFSYVIFSAFPIQSKIPVLGVAVPKDTRNDSLTTNNSSLVQLLLAETAIQHPFNLSYDPEDVKFLLYTDAKNPNQSQDLFLSDSDSVSRTNFDNSRRTVFLIHGFWTNGSSGMPQTIKKSFLQADNADASVPNIIIVDWGKLSTPNPEKEAYSALSYPLIVKKNIPTVCSRTAEFVQFLVDNRYTTLSKLHIIGFSLGAHVAGCVGRMVAKNSENGMGKIARITGLDPAGPLFQGIRVQTRITKVDADFVDIYHTAAGTLGTAVYDEGHANFMPNGGHHQPGCRDAKGPLMEADLGSCSHGFVYRFYGASISKNFKACRCEPKFHDHLVRASCPGGCTFSVLAGDRCPTDARGQYYFKTGEDPFSDEEENREDDNNSDNISNSSRPNSSKNPMNKYQGRSINNFNLRQFKL